MQKYKIIGIFSPNDIYRSEYADAKQVSSWQIKSQDSKLTNKIIRDE